MTSYHTKTVNGYGPYLYKSWYEGGEQQWEHVGPVAEVGHGPDIDNDTSETESGTMTGEIISASSAKDMLDEGFKLVDGDVDLDRWSKYGDRLYINNWVDDDVYIDLETGDVHGLDKYQLERRENGVLTVHTPGASNLTLQTGSDRKWETVKLSDVEEGDHIRYTEDKELSAGASAPEEAYWHRAPLRVDGVDKALHDSPYRPDEVVIETDLGTVKAGGKYVDREIVERSSPD